MPLMHPDKIMGKNVDNTDVPTNTQVLTFDSTKDEWDAEDAATSGSNFTERIRLTPGVPEGVVSFADVQALATASAKKTGQVLPDGASTSTFNYYCDVPNDLAPTPAASLKFKIIGLGTGTSDNVRLTVASVAVDDAGLLDAALTSETEATVPIPDAAETLEYYDQDMTNDPTAGEILLVQITRDPVDASDDYESNIMIVGAYLEIDRTTTT